MVLLPQAVRIRTTSGWRDIALQGAQGPAGSEVELGYVQRTTVMTIAAAAEATPDTVLTGPVLTFDGNTRIRLEFFCGRVNLDTIVGSTVVFSLYDGATGICRLLTLNNPTAASMVEPVRGALHLTPSAGNHQYMVKAWKTAGSPSIGCGSGTVFNDDPPAYLRITKVGPIPAALEPKWQQVQNVAGVTSVNFSSLDGDTDVAYELFGIFRWQSIGSDNELLLRFNNDAVAGGRYVWTQHGSYFDTASVAFPHNGSNTGTGISILRTHWNNDAYAMIRGTVYASVPPAGNFAHVFEYMGQGLFRADAAGPYTSLKEHAGQYYTPNVNLTSLQIVAPAGNLSGRFALRRLF